MRKPIEYRELRSEHGLSTASVICPFCDADNEVYAGSFAGVGKRCHSGSG